MIKDIFLGTVLITLVAILFWGFVVEMTTLSGKSIPEEDESKYNELSSNLTQAYNEVSGYASAGYSGITSVNVNPTQSEGQDIISMMGRFATSIIKTFINAFTLPVVIINSVANALGIPVAYTLIASFITTIVLTMVVLEILSVATRYPLDR